MDPGMENEYMWFGENKMEDTKKSHIGDTGIL